MKNFRLGFLIFTLLVLSHGVSSAQFDGDNRLFALSSDSPATIYSIDPATGAATEVVNLNGDSSIVGLSFINGIPFGSDLENFPGEQAAFNVGSISPTGTITFLSDQDGSLDWHGLASDDCDREVLYSVDNNSDGFLLKELSLNGSTRIIGPTGVDTDGMAYDDENGILYATDFVGINLYTISIEDGSSQLIGPTGNLEEANGLAYDEINKILYMLVESGDLYILNVNTGQATLVGNTGVDPDTDGLAWLDTCPLVRSIPTLSEWGMIAMAGVIGIVGFIAIRKKYATS